MHVLGTIDQSRAKGATIQKKSTAGNVQRKETAWDWMVERNEGYLYEKMEKNVDREGDIVFAKPCKCNFCVVNPKYPWTWSKKISGVRPPRYAYFPGSCSSSGLTLKLDCNWISRHFLVAIVSTPWPLSFPFQWSLIKCICSVFWHAKKRAIHVDGSCLLSWWWVRDQHNKK